jgi:uncharacterized protein (TIGR02217 family)
MQASNNNFLNIRFLQKVPFGTEFAMDAGVNIFASRGGAEVRSFSSLPPKRRYKIFLNKLKQEEVSELFSFFYLVGGSLKSFRFRDVTDCTASDELLVPLGQDGFSFRLAKSYFLNNEQGQAFSFTRLITKPVEQSLVLKNVKLNSILTDYTLDANAGTITFATKQDVKNLSASFTFDACVRFDTPSLCLKYLDTGFEQSGELVLVEVES